MLKHFGFGLVGRHRCANLGRSLVAVGDNETAQLLVTFPVKVGDVFQTGRHRGLHAARLLLNRSRVRCTRNLNVVVGIDHAADLHIGESLRPRGKRSRHNDRIVGIEIVGIFAACGARGDFHVARVLVRSDHPVAACFAYRPVSDVRSRRDVAHGRYVAGYHERIADFKPRVEHAARPAQCVRISVRVAFKVKNGMRARNVASGVQSNVARTKQPTAFGKRDGVCVRDRVH